MRELRSQEEHTAGQERPPGSLVVGKREDNNDDLVLYPKSLRSGLHVPGWSGKGKTNFFKHLVQQLIARKRAYPRQGFAIIDPHGGLAEYTLDLLALAGGDLVDDVYYMDFRQEVVLPLNPLWRWWPASEEEEVSRWADREFSAGCAWMEALVKTYGVRSSLNQPTIATMLIRLGQALISLGLSPVQARYFLNRGPEDRAVFRRLVGRLRPGECKSFWLDFDHKPAHTADAYVMGPRNRLLHVTGFNQFKLMLGQTDMSLDLLELMNGGGIAIFNLSLEDTEITTDAQQLFASLLLQQFRQVFPRRAADDSEQSPPFTLILDEFGDYCSPEFARAFTGARKFNFEIVFGHQLLDQLVPADGDQELLKAVLAVPNKAIFGGLPYDECKLLTMQVWLAMLDADKIKHQPYTVSFWPVAIKEVMRSVSAGGSNIEAVAQAASEFSGTHEVSGQTAAPVTGLLGMQGEELQLLTSSMGLTSSSGRSRSHMFGSAHSWSETMQEAWRTEYKPFLQPGTPVFESIEDQVFRYAQAMHLRPTGRFVFAQGEGTPLYGYVDLVAQRPLSAEERGEFLEKVYRKAVYRRRDEAARHIEAFERELGGGDDEPIVVS